MCALCYIAITWKQKSSEQASRRMAMENATDNAEELKEADIIIDLEAINTN